MTPTERRASSVELGERLSRWALRPVDMAWLVGFRVLFGLTLAVSMWRFLANGWVNRFFVEPSFHFKYWGFAWVEPLSGPAMHAVVWGLLVLSLFIALGAAFRISAILFALGLSYLQLIDVSTYLNHYYLAALLAWLLAISPAARVHSVDAWLARRFRRTRAPEQAAAAWLYLFRFQVALVYVFAGLAKAQPDWLLHAQPLRIWLAASVDLPVLGPLLSLEGVPVVLSWCGFLFDTTIVLWLSLSRTRPYAYAVVVLFHALTRLLFPIGMFPVIMVVSALVFFPASWPRELWRRLAALSASGGAAKLGLSPEPALPNRSPALPPALSGRLALLLGVAYCMLQLLLPLRFLAYGGNVLWHEQGMRFSWRVMVRAKGGSTTFVVHSPETGRTHHVSPRAYLTPMQEEEMSSQPDLILQLAQRIAKDAKQQGLGSVQVRVDSQVSLNGRRSAPLIDPRIDLVGLKDGIDRQPWILPAPTRPPPHTRIVL